MDRRGFLSFLTRASIAATVAPMKFLDALMPWPGSTLTDFQLDAIVPAPALDAINEITTKYIYPMLADEIFKPSPVFWALRERGRIKIAESPILTPVAQW